jgi:hypothetical protein
MRGQVARLEEGRNSFKILTSKSTNSRPRHRWEDNIKYIFTIGVNKENWGFSAQDKNYWRALVNT